MSYRSDPPLGPRAGRDQRDSRDYRDYRDRRDNRDYRRDNRDYRDRRDYRDHRDHRDRRDYRDHRDHRDHRDYNDRRNGRYDRPRDTRDARNRTTLDQLRKEISTKWDLSPPGFDKVTVESIKLTGLFPQPGMKRQHVDYQRLITILGEDNVINNGNDLSEINLSDSKLSKTAIISVPSEKIDQVIQFINNFIITLELDNEFVNSTVTTIAIAMSGLTLPNDTYELNIKRPNGYILSLYDTEDNIYKLAITNIPKSTTQESLKELIEPQTSNIKELQILRNQLTQENVGIAFIKFETPEETMSAVPIINNLEIGTQKLTCIQVCNSSLTQESVLNFYNLSDAASGKITTVKQPTSTLIFLNCLNSSDTESTYPQIVQDFQKRCSQYGDVEVNIENGLIYVKFISSDIAEKALEDISGDKFGERTVIGTYSIS